MTWQKVDVDPKLKSNMTDDGRRPKTVKVTGKFTLLYIATCFYILCYNI